MRGAACATQAAIAGISSSTCSTLWQPTITARSGKLVLDKALLACKLISVSDSTGPMAVDAMRMS
ncbi:hypothetical protein D3C81_2155130 [compost metagenome]